MTSSIAHLLRFHLTSRRRAAARVATTSRARRPPPPLDERGPEAPQRRASAGGRRPPLYVAVLVREAEGLLKLVLTRPARVTVPGESYASERITLAIGGVITVAGRDVSVDGAAHLQFATAAEAKAFAAAAGEPTTAVRVSV